MFPKFNRMHTSEVSLQIQSFCVDFLTDCILLYDLFIGYIIYWS